ncbi:hypothetical protein CWATWH0402_5822 [Crocosphaera watsonii WH 0402]|uniref:Uncharacterized protein n=1 Tax=Crocosphaera watsonii WH 0402 TaxID=1284629 RepID=T2JV19_CROWT|nr:hypothetical protein CWATWH0402_5822 [Crocosphaera watsonii WH 0402]
MLFAITVPEIFFTSSPEFAALFPETILLLIFIVPAPL